MRFRQVHLDFHTSEKIPGVGSAFSREQFQEMLILGHVDSITVFAKCHHGMHYHPTAVGRQHPGLAFDLLAAQIEAAHAIGVKTPVYLSAGLDEHAYWAHPEYARHERNGSVPWAGSNDNPGFHELCMNTPYLDLLAAEVEEVVQRYDADGIFLDIVSPRDCWCNACVVERQAEGPVADPVLIAKQSRRIYLKYCARMRAAIDKHKPGLGLFHNGGHVTRGDRELARQNTHLELESLPTGGWGYDHFPISAGNARALGMPFLGMTGKFHLSWGEFGGFKHPNALRYEAAAAVAQGGRVSIGDQLHPDGRMEEATYAIIGAAYAEVEAKEPWLTDATSRAEVALLSEEAVRIAPAHGNHGGSDEGASRILLEGGICFDVVDAQTDLSSYRLVILPDTIRLRPELEARLKAYIAAGGRILATGESGLAHDRDEQLLDFGADDGGKWTFDPDYIAPRFAVAPWRAAAFVVYAPGRTLVLRGGEVLADREAPYFNRQFMSFCSHQHTPNRRGPAGPAIVRGPSGTWIAHPLCKVYTDKGQQVIRDIVLHCIRRELGIGQVTTGLGCFGRVTLMRQESQRRDVLHLLFATPAKRGNGVEVIEDLVPRTDVRVEVARTAKPSRVRLVPGGAPVPFAYVDGRVSFTVPTVACHQMVELAD